MGGLGGVLESKADLRGTVCFREQHLLVGRGGHVVGPAPGQVLPVTGNVLVFTPHLAQPPGRTVTSQGCSLQLRLQERLKVQHLLTAPQSRAAGPPLKGALSLSARKPGPHVLEETEAWKRRSPPRTPQES